MFAVHQTAGRVSCCKCGILMPPDSANMCTRCLSSVDITEGLKKNVVIVQCPKCYKYLQPPRTWIRAVLESKELLVYCLNMVNLNMVLLTNAKFIWTEPHSKRIKLKLTVQKEVVKGAILEQSYVVDYVVHEQTCDSCTRVHPDQWIAAVQLRQNVSHRQAFFYLEQQILKHGAAGHCIRIKQVNQGIDFFFNNRNHALKFVEFLSKVVPVQYRSEMFHDNRSNSNSCKHSFSVEMSPICREDLVCLPRRVAVSLGNLGPIVICTKVSSSITLMDPFTLRHCLLDADKYFRSSFKPLLSSRQLVEYVVLNVKPGPPEVTVCGSRYALVEADVARVSDFGKNDTSFIVTTHLGLVLKPGDHALGYDLCGINNNDIEVESLPNVVLIKKSYEEKRMKRRGKPRAWKLKSLAMEDDSSTAKDRDYEERKDLEYERFLRDLEENPDMWFNVSLYRNKEYQPSEMAPASDGDEVPSIPLEKMFEDLDLRDDEDDLIMAE